MPPAPARAARRRARRRSRCGAPGSATPRRRRSPDTTADAETMSAGSSRGGPPQAALAVDREGLSVPPHSAAAEGQDPDRHREDVPERKEARVGQARNAGGPPRDVPTGQPGHEIRGERRHRRRRRAGAGEREEREGQPEGDERQQITHRPHGADRAGPPELVADQRPEVVLVDDRLDDERRELDAPATLRHHPSEHVIVGEVVDDALETPQRVEHVPAACDRGAERVRQWLQRGCHQGRREEPVVDVHRPDGRRKAWNQYSDVEAGDEAVPLVGERRHDGPQVFGPHPDVAVGQDDHVVPGTLVDVDDVAQFRIRTQRMTIADEHDVEAGEFFDEPMHDVNGGIARIADPEDELKARVGLLAEAAERLVEERLHAAQWLQHTDRWRKVGVGGTAASEGVSAIRRPRPVSRGDERERDENIGHVGHDMAPVFAISGRLPTGAGRQAIAQTTRPPAAHASSRRCRRSPNAKPALGARPRAAKMAVLLPSWIPILAGTMNSTPSTAADSVSMEMIVDADTRSPSERQMRYASTAPHAYAAAKSNVAAANRPR